MSEYYIAAIDLGGSKIVGAVAKKSDEGIEIIDVEEEPTSKECIKQGKIVSVDEAAIQISRILKKLCNCIPMKTINHCYVTCQNAKDCQQNIEILKTKRIKSTKLIFPPISTATLLANKYASENERRTGCLSIDYGHTATSYSYIDGAEIKKEGCIIAGSYQISTDLMQLFNYNYKLAESLKKILGKATVGETDKLIDLGNGNFVKVSELSKEIIARIDDTFLRVLRYMGEQQWHSNRNRIIIIGGSGANLQNIDKYLHNHTGLTVRFAKQKENEFKGEQAIKLNSYGYAALSSLIVYATKPCDDELPKVSNRMTKKLKEIIQRSTATATNLFDATDTEEEKFPTKKQ